MQILEEKRVLRHVTLGKVELQLIDVTPAPILSGLKRSHDGMLYGVKMFGRVLVLRRIAAPYMPTAEANPQVDPRVSDFQALFTATCIRFYVSDLAQMLALSHVFASPAY